MIASFVGSTDYTAASATTTFTIGKAMPTVQVNDSGGIYNGGALAATTTVAGITGPGNSLEGVSPSVTYYDGLRRSGMALSAYSEQCRHIYRDRELRGQHGLCGRERTTTFTIGKATPTVQVNDSGGIYNGRALPRPRRWPVLQAPAVRSKASVRA